MSNQHSVFLVTPDSLDAAWAEAEAALPKGWRVLLGQDDADKSGWWATASGPRLPPHGYFAIISTSAGGHLEPSPAAAFRALAAKLRKERP